MNTNVQTAAAGGALAALGGLKAGLQNVQTSTRAKGGEPIMRLGRDGKWIFGAENLEVEDGALWAINPLSIQHGSICWKVIPDGSKESPELLGEVMVPANAAKPALDSLPVYHNTDGSVAPWNDQLSFDLLCIKGEDEGEQVLYKTSSTGGIRAVKEFLAALDAQIDKDISTPVAVVELKSDSYQHKSYGKTYFPVFAIEKWVPMDKAPTAEPAPQQAKAVEPKPEPEQKAAEPEPEQAAPSEGGERRRRRRG